MSPTVNALAWGARATFALFFVAILAEFPWGRGPTALGYSLSWLSFVGFAPVAGWLHDPWGAVYTPDGVTRLVDAVNARLRERQPMLAAERERLQTELREVRRRLDGLRRFVEQGDTSSDRPMQAPCQVRQSPWNVRPWRVGLGCGRSARQGQT